MTHLALLHNIGFSDFGLCIYFPWIGSISMILEYRAVGSNILWSIFTRMRNWVLRLGFNIIKSVRNYSMEVQPIAALSDNYMYLITSENGKVHLRFFIYVTNC